MNTLKYYLFIAAVVIFPSCLSVTDDCACTMEFRMVTVVVVDGQNIPVRNLQTEVKTPGGKQYNFNNEDPFFDGHYVVMSDNHTNDFSVTPSMILFRGVKDSLSVYGEFLINTDPCKCHIEKFSGPDTLILK